MLLKADENMASAVIHLFRERGHDLATTSEEGLNGRTDEVVFAAAIREGRMLLTLDRGFADIRAYPPGTHPGVILIRCPDQSVASVKRMCRLLLDEFDLETLRGCIVILQPGGVRVRRV